MINRVNSTDTNINKEKTVSFKGVHTSVLNGLGWMKNNPAMAACATDFAFMVAPRTYVELKERGKQSGIETFIREISSLLIHATMGLIGFASASVLSGKFNKDNGVKSQNIYTANNTTKNMSERWINSDCKRKEFFDSFIKNIQGLNGTDWKAISPNSQKEITQKLIELADKTKLLDNEKNNTEISRQIKDLKSLLVAKITQDTGAKDSFKLLSSGKAKEIHANISELIDNAVSLSNAFDTKNGKKEVSEFVKSLMKNKSASTVLGLGITFLLSVSVQPINRMLTKKRTGNDGFVGVDSKENDNSQKFKVMKTLAGLGFPIFAFSTIGCKAKDLISNVQFNGKIPSLNQFKLIYGCTIGSRLLASRDGNELRESLIKDTLGFSTWLLFGDFVSKLTSRIIGGKELINNPVSQNSSKNKLSYAKDWLMKSSVKSFDELLLPQAKEVQKDGKRLTLQELYKNSPAELKTKIIKTAFSQITGYLFSGIVLGWGITKFNIFVTKHINKQNEQNEHPKNNFDIDYMSKLSKNSNPIFKDFV